MGDEGLSVLRQIAERVLGLVKYIDEFSGVVVVSLADFFDFCDCCARYFIVLHCFLFFGFVEIMGVRKLVGLL